MQVLRTLEQPEEKYSLAFLGYGDEASTAVLELTYNHGITSYDSGTGYGHVAISVTDCHQACADIKARGGTIIYGADSAQGHGRGDSVHLGPGRLSDRTDPEAM
jgi:lactoylglutathione lyase